LGIGVFVAVSGLVRLMRRRRDEVLAELTAQAREEQHKKKLAEKLEKRDPEPAESLASALDLYSGRNDGKQKQDRKARIKRWEKLLGQMREKKHERSLAVAANGLARAFLSGESLAEPIDADRASRSTPQGLFEAKRRAAADPGSGTPTYFEENGRTCQNVRTKEGFTVRILANFTAASEGVTSDTVIKKLLAETPTSDQDLTRDERFKKMFAS
jgi:MoxR-like ATPase